MDLEQAADELYAVSPDDFIAQRTALVGEARAANDRALAKEIGQLRRPTRSAWLVNILARAERSASPSCSSSVPPCSGPSSGWRATNCAGCPRNAGS